MSTYKVIIPEGVAISIPSGPDDLVMLVRAPITAALPVSWKIKYLHSSCLGELPILPMEKADSVNELTLVCPHCSYKVTISHRLLPKIWSKLKQKETIFKYKLDAMMLIALIAVSEVLPEGMKYTCPIAIES